MESDIKKVVILIKLKP